MKLPDYARSCLDALETAGFAAYAVGGCVRDTCLGLEPKDFDLCTAALPEQICRVFAGERLVLAGQKHGTVGVVTQGGVVEITTFRTEGGYRDHRHPDWVRFVPEVEGDLARRDFTINAMAYSPHRGFADPFGGRQDLHRKVLRAVGDPERRFREDALRILRGVRFAAAYGLTPEPATLEAMTAQACLLEDLARERVFAELSKLLPLLTTADMLRFAPVLTAAVPELKPMVGFDQHSPHHAYDVYTHTAHVVEGVAPTPEVRWAALLHDTGKVPSFTRDLTGRGHFYGHAALSARIADQTLGRLKAPAALRQRVCALIANHMTRLEPEKKALRRQLSRLGWEGLEDLISLQEADMKGKGVLEPGQTDPFPTLRALLEQLRREDACLKVKDLDINGHDLMALGYEGPALGRCLERLLELVLDEQLPNTRPALLEAARRGKGEAI